MYRPDITALVDWVLNTKLLTYLSKHLWLSAHAATYADTVSTTKESETGMSASVLKQDPNKEKNQTDAIY